MINKIIVILNLFIVLCVTENDNHTNNSSPSQALKNNATFSTVYDQRQTGKYNINVNIKDLAIISVEPENLSANIGDTGSFYEDYYDYDLDDFTISPVSALLGSVNDTRPSSRPTSEQTDTTPNSSSQSTIILSADLTTIAEPIKQTTSNKPNQNVNDSNDIPTISATIDNNLNHQQNQQQQIPVQIIMDPIVNKLPSKMRTQSRYRSKQQHHQQQHSINGRNSPSNGDGYNLRSRNLNKLASSERKIDNVCDNDEFRDRHGRCRSRRTALRKIVDLFTMMIPNDE